jgi:hypothetical protein
MAIPKFRSLMISCAFAMAAQLAQTQTEPAMKPGLWQIHVESEVNGQKTPDMAERMKNMDPETRRRMEAAMKQRGIDSGDNGGRRACYSQETIKQGRWAEQQSGCKIDYSSRSATSWKWHSSCPQIGYEGDGEATFSNSENYVVKSTGVMTSGGKPRSTRTTVTAKWLAADCGDLKPLDLKP